MLVAYLKDKRDHLQSRPPPRPAACVQSHPSPQPAGTKNVTCTTHATCSVLPRPTSWPASFENERETGTLFGRSRRRSRHDSADRDAGVGLYDRHVLARRLSRASGRFEFQVVSLHLRNACRPASLKNERRPPSAPARPARSFFKRISILADPLTKRRLYLQNVSTTGIIRHSRFGITDSA